MVQIMLNQAISKTEYKSILEVLAQEIPHGLLFSGVQRRITEYQIRYGCDEWLKYYVHSHIEEWLPKRN